MSKLDDWVADAAAELGLPAESITLELRDQLLDLTRDAAHGIARVAGPLTTYLVGLAVAGGMAPTTVIARLSDLAKARADSPDEEPAGGAAATGVGPA